MWTWYCFIWYLPLELFSNTILTINQNILNYYFIFVIFLLISCVYVTLYIITVNNNKIFASSFCIFYSYLFFFFWWTWKQVPVFKAGEQITIENLHLHHSSQEKLCCITHMLLLSSGWSAKKINTCASINRLWMVSILNVNTEVSSELKLLT